MLYLTKAAEIRTLIAKLTSCPILWVDTEVADWQTHNPRISLIQVLAQPTDLTGNSTYILDVLDKPDLVAEFVNQIVANPNIEKVFHNANFDLRYLGGKDKAQNVTCTLKIAKNISLNILGTSDRKLKTLAAELCNFSNVDTEEQRSDWGRRPLSDNQLKYARMDTVYLAYVHRRLLELINKNNFEKVSKKTKIKNIVFNVTNVRVAFECPRLFYLNYNFQGKTLFVPPDYLKGVGYTFHKLAEELIVFAKREPRLIDLLKPDAEQLDVEAIASQIQQLFYEQVFFSHLQTAIQQNSAQATVLHKIFQGLTRVIYHWSELLKKNRRHCIPNQVINLTLIDKELSLDYNFTLPDGSQKKLLGKLDSLVYDFEKHRLCVVEYKTYQPVDPSAQLVQVALYSYMLREKKKVPVDCAVYCVLPEFKEYYYSWEQLENTVHQLIPQKLQQMRQWIAWEEGKPEPPPPTPQPHLCDICPEREKCQTFFLVRRGPTQEIITKLPTSKKREFIQQPVKPQKPVNLPTPNADAIGQQLVTTLQSFKIDVDYLGAAVGPSFIRVKLKPNLGVKVASLLKLSADLQVQLGIANPPMIAPQPGYVSIDLPCKDRQIAHFEKYIQHQETPVDAPVKIAIGVDLEGQLVEADLSDPNTCHFLMGGTTGSGKSEFLRSLLLSLLYRHPPQQIKIALVDPKRVTFPEFEQIPWLLSPVVKDSDAAIELMEELVTEMERRYQLFERAKCPHLNAYNQQLAQRQQPPVARIICIFDEYADFMAEKEIRNALEQSIKRLGAMARAAGIHLIIATQRPEAGVVTPIIRANLPGRIALRTASEADSQIILGGKSTEAAYLLGKGDLLYQVGAQLQRLQSLFAATIQLPD